MKTLVEKDIELQKEKILKEYSYLDDLDLNGWVWEFLRRSNEYKEFHRKAEGISHIFEDEQACLSEQHIFEFWLLFLNGLRFFEWDTMFSFSYRAYNTDLPHVKKNEGSGFIVISKGDRSGTFWEYFMIPRYDTPYNFFSDFHTGKPRMRGALPFIIKSNTKDNYTSQVSEWLAQHIKDEKEDRISGTEALIKDVFCQTRIPETDLKNNLSLTVIISNKIKSKDIEGDLVSQIKHYINKNLLLQPEYSLDKKISRQRGEWKYYLIVYDLIENDHLYAEEITRIFEGIFPQEKKWKESTIDRYFTNGRKMIQEQTYKEYLYF